MHSVFIALQERALQNPFLSKIYLYLKQKLLYVHTILVIQVKKRQQFRGLQRNIAVDKTEQRFTFFPEPL